MTWLVVALLVGGMVTLVAAASPRTRGVVLRLVALSVALVVSIVPLLWFVTIPIAFWAAVSAARLIWRGGDPPAIRVIRAESSTAHLALPLTPSEPTDRYEL